MAKNALPFFIAGLILLLAVLLVIPSTSQVLFSLVGIDISGRSTVGSDFDVFIPFVPGYFPEDFSITAVGVSGDEAPSMAAYSEFYASSEHFFKIIQTKGEDLPEAIANPNLIVQGSPASMVSQVDVNALIGEDLDLEQYDTSEVWLLTVVMNEIQVQVVSNHTSEEVIRFANELVPQRCTKTPTPEG